MGESDEIYKLELLSLVSKITTEILNHTGINDRVLAEFVLSLHDQAASLAAFKKSLDDVGAEFPDSFVQSLDRIIVALHPKHKKAKSAAAASSASAAAAGPSASAAETKVLDAEKERQRRMFPGLALPDQDWKAPREDTAEERKRSQALREREEDAAAAARASGKGAAGGEDVDDMMRSLEQLEGRARGSGAGNSAPTKRRWGARSPSPEQRRRGSRSPPPRNGDRYGAPPPVRDAYGSSQSSRGRDARPRAPLDDRPQIYKIYEGKVSGMKDFGAFVTLEGLAGRHEGECLRHTNAGAQRCG
jgi:ATP-dependent RNA helicase DHX8/PRP22